MNENKRMRTIQRLTIITLFLLIFMLVRELFSTQLRALLQAANTILIPAAIALFISYLLAPIVELLEKKTPIKKRWVNIIIVFTATIILGTLFGYFVGVTIYEQALGFIETDWDNIIVFVEDFIQNNDFFHQANEFLSNYLQVSVLPPILVNVLSVFNTLISIAITIVLVPVFLFFILNDKKVLFDGIIGLFPNKWQVHIRNLGSRGNEVVEKYFNGRFISMFIMSIFYTIVFFILGLRERSIFFGFTLGFLDLVPYIGPMIGVILPFLYAFTTNDTTLFNEYTPYAILIVNFVGQFLQGNILQPIIMGKEVDLHPLLVLSSFLFFGSLFGIVGIILAIPITGMMKSTLEYVRELNDAEKAKLKKG